MRREATTNCHGVVVGAQRQRNLFHFLVHRKELKGMNLKRKNVFVFWGIVLIEYLREKSISRFIRWEGFIKEWYGFKKEKVLMVCNKVKNL